MSLSSVQAFQRCEARYYYAYVRRLRPRVRDAAPALGTLIHAYLESYYRGLRDGLSVLESHAAGIDRIDRNHKLMAEIINTALSVGDEEAANEFIGLLPKAKRIMCSYFDVRGKQDAREYDVLMVEQKLDAEIVSGVVSRSVIDLVTRHRQTGRVALWEHKSTSSVPSSSVRLRDLQTLLYATVLQAYGTHTDEVIWNYIRTKEPVIPELLKSGHFSKDKRLDTTWTVYSAALKTAGRDPNSAFYSDMKSRLMGREESVFFPRYSHVIVADPHLLLGDYANVASRINARVQLWAAGNDRPIRHLSRDCDWCPFYRICEAAVVGGDEEDVIHMRFTTEPEQEDDVGGNPETLGDP